MDTRGMRLGLTVLVTVGGLLLVMPSLRAAELPPKLKEVLREAQQLQEKGEKGDYLAYAQAWEKYQQIRKAEHNPPKEVIDGAQFCLRRVQQFRRLRDKPSQARLGDLSSSDALNLYADLLADLREKYYFDRTKVHFGDLFQYGVQELRFALEDDAFLKEQVRADVEPAALQALRAQLEGLRMEQPTIKKPADAREQLQSVMLSARGVGVKPTVVLVEFISGACNALDEYTNYLSPRRLDEIEADQSGKYVGIGVDVALYCEKGAKQLAVTKVYENGPAYGKLNAGDAILSIDGQAMDPAASVAFAARLEGEAGTTVELEVKSLDGMKRKVKVERQVVFVPSVVAEPMVSDEGVGWIRIASFQTTTPEEVRSAVLQLRNQRDGLKALVLDLRGNLGGSFEAGVKVAELFLSEGVIVYTQMRTKEKARRANNPDAFTVPLVVLVDANTASAAEVVAGALKDNNHRAILVGQQTYGKGSIQYPVPLKSLKAGMHVTIARFSSPERVPYDGHGVIPHELVENSMMMMDDAQARNRAMDQAISLAGMAAPMKRPPMD